MTPVASQMIEEVTAHAQSDSLEDAREICADGTYFLNNLCILILIYFNSSLNTSLLVINHQQHVSSIKAIFRLKTIIIRDVYSSATNVTDEVLSCIHLRYCKMYQT